MFNVHSRPAVRVAMMYNVNHRVIQVQNTPMSVREKRPTTGKSGDSLTCCEHQRLTIQLSNVDIVSTIEHAW